MSWSGELLKAVVSNFRHVIYGGVVLGSITAYSFSGHNMSYKREGDTTTAFMKKESEKTRELMQKLIAENNKLIEENNKPIVKTLKKNTAILEKLEKTVEKLEESVACNIEAIRGLTSAVSDLRSWRASDCGFMQHNCITKHF